MKLKKRFITTILFIVFLFTTYTSSLAVGINKDDTMSYLSQTISSYLPILESDAHAMGFENVDFSNVKIGSEISAYKVGSSSVESSEYRIFPLFSGNRIFAICSLVTNDDGSRSVTVSKSYAESLNSINSAFTLLFGYNAVYAVYQNGAYTKLQDTSPTPQVTTLSFNDAVSAVRHSCTSISATTPVAYTPSATRVINYRYLNVPTVLQYGRPLCWAACMASVINYYHSSSYSAAGILTFLGVEEEGQSMADMARWLSTYWYIGTYVYPSKLSFATTVQYIDADMPLIARLANSNNSGHFVVVRGYYHDVNTSVYHVSYMEPNTGMCLTTFNSSGGFSHTLNGTVYTQERYMTTDY